MNQLSEKEQLGPVKQFISENRIYSVSRQNVSMSIDEQLEYIRNHPSVDLEKVTEELGWSLNSGDILKLQVLEEIHKNEPNTNVLAIDDFQYAGILKQGVRVYEKGYFSP